MANFNFILVLVPKFPGSLNLSFHNLSIYQFFRKNPSLAQFIPRIYNKIIIKIIEYFWGVTSGIVIHWISWPNYTLERLSNCMVRQFPLFQTEIPGLPHVFGPVYRMPLALGYVSIRLFIHRRMANLRELYRL